MSEAIVKHKPHAHDPDEYRMTIGEHLEELRTRMILALGGFGVVFALCLIFVKSYVLPAFCTPLFVALHDANVNPQVYFTQMADPFMVYIKVSLVAAIAISSPWIVYQFWLFVAAGLYAHERHIVTRYVPLSLTLLISGMLFVYYLVLPWTLQFFMAFSISIPVPNIFGSSPRLPNVQPTTIPVLHGDPVKPVDGQLWANLDEGRLKLFMGDKLRILQFGPENLASPIITLPDYIDLVFGMLLTFGLSFQLPLVVMALVAIGIVDRDMLKGARRYVYFGMSILAAAITPGDVITATVALMFPLIGLFELGIWLSRERKETISSDT